MKGPQFAKARDANEPEIVDALERWGFSVARLDTPVDLLVGKYRLTILLEVKDGRKPPSARPLTQDQKKFFAEWRGAEPYVVRSITEAACVLGVNKCPGWTVSAGCDCGGIDDPPWFVEERAKHDKRRANR